ncbi:hypothetical protein MXD98_16765, partial [Legionella pneumophila]|nr:hypothetical protein [Legionella pneumophila]
DSTFKHVIALDLVSYDEGEAWLHDLKTQGYKNINFRHMDVTDRENAIIAATYGDCDKRNTTEPTGVAKKIREVGEDF